MVFSDRSSNFSSGLGDPLDRSPFVGTAQRLLEYVAAGQDSTVLALIGPWGAGKTSMLDELRKGALGSGTYLGIGEVNPWMFSDSSALINAFFNELRSCLPHGKKWRKGRESAGSALQGLANYMDLVPGVSASRAVDHVGRTVGGDTGPSKMMEKASRALSDLPSPILIVMDDLDRLEPAELLMTFKLIRLVGRLPNVHYLLAYDEQTLLDVLSNTDLVGQGEHSKQRAKEYLEKIVQFRLDLPVFRPEQRDSLIASEFERCLAEGMLQASTADIARFSLALDMHLRSRLSTPRAILRYFAQVSGFASVLKGEVSVGDLLVATWIRTAEPGLWQELHTKKNDLVGAGDVVIAVMANDGQRIAELQNEWRQLLADHEVDTSHREGVLKVLALLFPTMNRLFSQHHSDSEGERRGIGDADYFERYFAFGVPSGEVTDAQVRALIAESSDPNWQTTGGITLRQLLLEHGDPVAQKLALALEDNTAQRFPVMSVLRDVVETDPTPPNAVDCPRRSAERVSGQLLNDKDSALLRALLRDWREDDWGLRLLGQALNRGRYDSALSPEEFEQCTSEFLLTLEARLNVLSLSMSVSELSDAGWFLTWVWNWLNPNDRRAWLRGTVSSGRWDALDLSARFVEQDWSRANADWRLKTDELEAAIGLDLIREHAELPPRAGLSTVRLPRADEPLTEFRRRVAILDLAIKE